MYTMTTADSITFVMEGSEQVLSLRAKISVKLGDITNVTWHERFSDWPKMQVRMPGTYLPRWIMAGSYYSDEGWDFVLAKKPKGMMQPVLFDVLVVETTQDRYKRIIIRTDKEKATEVIDWWKSNK